MMNAITHCLVLLQFALFASSNAPSVPTSPIRHWDASWAASCVQGTAIAMVHGDCAILFLRSPATNVWREHSESSSVEEDLMGLSVYPLKSSRVEFAPPWLSFSNSLCAMTGLASDVEHLCRVLQRQVDSHYTIYDDVLPVHSMAERVGELFHDEARSKGGRPFGVQTLLVGGDDIDTAKKLCLYTIDPSGSWQSWPWGTSIGKFAKEVRTELAKKVESPPTSLNEALEQIVDCWIETCKAQNVNIKAEEDFQVLILKAPTESKRCKAYKVKKDDIDTIVNNAVATATNTRS